MRLRLSARLRTVFRTLRSFTQYKYSVLGGEGGGRLRTSEKPERCHVSPILSVPFYIGLPSSVLLLYVNPFIALLLSFPLLFLVVVFFFHSIENALVYACDEPEQARLLCEAPEDYGFHTWEPVELFPDGKPEPVISGYLLLHDDPSIRCSCPTVLILHGNAGNIGHRLPFCRLLADSVQCNIMIIDYRGYGRSNGRPSEWGLYADAEAGLEFLMERTDISKDKLFLFGRSIGGAVAIHLAFHCRSAMLRGVIIENSFTSLPETAQHIFTRSFGVAAQYLLPKWLFVNKYPSLERLRELTISGQVCPRFLFISGSADDLVPPRMMRELADMYHTVRGNNLTQTITTSINPSEFLKAGRDGLVCFPEGQHNTTWLLPEYGSVISHFIQQALHDLPAFPSVIQHMTEYIEQLT